MRLRCARTVLSSSVSPRKDARRSSIARPSMLSALRPRLFRKPTVGPRGPSLPGPTWLHAAVYRRPWSTRRYVPGLTGAEAGTARIHAGVRNHFGLTQEVSLV